jgi:outer membrane protein TolC
MRPTSPLILFLLVVAPGEALGREGAACSNAEELAAGSVTPETVTEHVFVAAVDAAHPAARALSGDLGAAEARRLQTSLLDDPRLELTREAPADVARETTWGLVWTPPIDGRRSKAIRAAEAGVEVETHRLEDRLIALRSDVREAFAAWATGEARVSLLADHSGRLEELARRMWNRAEAGEESLLAAQRLEIASRRSGISLSEARALGARSRETAAAWLLDDGPELASMKPELPALPEAPSDLDSRITESRPDVLAARSEVERAESLGELSRRILEAPELLLGWKSIENDLTAGGGDLDGPVFGIGWKVPVFGRRRADRLEAESALAAAEASEKWLARRARSELAAANAAYGELRESALAAQIELGELDGVARAAEASFEAGESTVTDLLDTLGALLDARLAALDLYASALGAHRQLEAAAGRSLTSGDPS